MINLVTDGAKFLRSYLNEPIMPKNDGRVVSNLIFQSLLNESITIIRNLNQTRSFCYFDYLINLLIEVMESNFFTGPVNLGFDLTFKYFKSVIQKWKERLKIFAV